ncbi:T9SS type A sorting domain-containing protein [Flavobacterium cheniae]|nr:T9SS type A sorting domain-containing protein [Flavobacterium cheniae]
MKKLYFLFFLTIGLLANAQIINFPDIYFKAKLLQASTTNNIASSQEPVYDLISETWSVSSYNKIDTNNNGEIEVSEAQSIKWLDISLYSIDDMSGIEYFTNLIYLNCSGNQVSSLNVSNLTNLKVLNCGSNRLMNLNISGLFDLQNLDCKYNRLTSLNFTGFNNLKMLNCIDNQLTFLNISDLVNLKILKCYDNQISTLNVSNSTNLLELYCGNNQMNSLNISGLIFLVKLDCYNNLLPSLDVSGLINLQDLNCSFNPLSSLNISNLHDLETLNCSNNELTNLNVSDLPNLQFLHCGSNQLSSLDVSELTSLQTLNCSYNELFNLNVTGLNNLQFFDCNSNMLTTLNLSGLNNLQTLNCEINELISLDTSDLSNLQTLICDGNQITNLFIKNNNTTWAQLYCLNNPNLEYICIDEEDLSFLQQMIDSAGLTNQIQLNSYCSFTPNGIFYEVSGTTKFDSNNNSCDVSDINYSNLNFSITDGTNTGSLIANQTGNFYIPVSAGNHTITPNLENPSYFNIFPTSFTVNFPTQTSPFMQDFCVTANGVKSDVEVVLVLTTPARPGFDANYKLVYRNKGNQVENGSVSLTFDDARLDFVSSNPVYNSSVTNSFTWNYSNLQPFETREIGIVFNVNSPMETPAVNNGDILNYTATITTANTDETPLDNTFILDQTVVGSYDPNDKTCLEGTTIEPSEVGNYVHYVIRFENTGTYPAENIVVKDMIDLDKFDIATLVPLKSSHDFFTRISGNKVEFIFENINLDFNDATNDGYVVFKIKTKPTLVLGDTFTNNANIYFDYNFPITTNTYITTVAALSTQDFDFGTYFTLYPNPAKDVLNIQDKQGLTINSIEVYNQLGQIVMAVTNALNAVDVANLASGTYFVKINTEKGSTNAKFVKE